MEYIALASGVNTRKLIPADEDLSTYINPNSDYYQSVFYYSEHHKLQFDKTHSLSGMKDVTTDRLVWDFDNKDDIEAARKDARELCSRLIINGVPQDAIHIAFSGMKGFSVEVKGDKRVTPDEFKQINRTLAEDLRTNDTTIADAARIFRICGTKHNKSGLFKMPITIAQLSELPVGEIKNLAQDIDNATAPLKPTPTQIPPGIYNMRVGKTQPKPAPSQTIDVSELDFKSKPRGFSNCKFAIMNGFFPDGLRNNPLLALAATCKAQGYPKEITYNICKGAARLQAQRTGSEPFSKSELWNNTINQVYGPNWQGAQFSCKKQDWLHGICASLGSHRCQHDEDAPLFLSAMDMSVGFEDYSLNIEKNTIKTGIPALDDNVSLTVGMPVGLLGAPSSGKTSLALNILNNTSLMGIHSAFFSMDMYGPLVFMKKVQKLTGLQPKDVHKVWKTDPKRALQIKDQIKEQYKNVRFSTKSGLSVAEMREIVNEEQDRTGDKIKLILIDYLECISGPYSDATANTAKIAGELKDFATEMGVCVITLVQPPKSAGDASAPLMSMRAIKGASMLEQSFRVIFGVYREGFGPKTPGDDRFMTINALKNTMGPLFSVDLAWNGVRGEIAELDESGELLLNELRNKRAKEANNNKEPW